MMRAPFTPRALGAALAVSLAGLALGLCGCTPGGADGEVGATRKVIGTDGALQLELREAAGVKRTLEPVRVGLPFPRGVLARARNVRVVLSDGRETASQCRPLARWPDGSVRWLELCFEPSVAANSVGRYRVEFGPKLKAAKVLQPLTAALSKGIINVDTGRLRLAVDTGKGSIQAWLDRDGDGKYAALERVLARQGLESFVELETLKKGKKAEAGRFTARAVGARLEEAGPLRAVVAWRGWHLGKSGRRVCPYAVRLYAYRGKSCLRLVHTLTLSEDPAKSRIAEAGLALDLESGRAPLAGRELRQEVARPKRYPDLAGFEPGFRLTAGQRVLSRGKARSFLVTRGERFRLVAVRPRAAESAPWEMRVEPKSSRLVCAFWPRWGAAYTDARSPAGRGEPGFLEFTRTESYERFWTEPAGNHGVGAARTGELWVSFDAPGKKGGGAASFAARAAWPLLAWPGAGWWELSGAFGRFAPKAGGRMADSAARGTGRLAAWLRSHQRERFGWLGLWDYGDYQTIYGRRGDLDVGARWWNWHGKWGWMQGRGSFLSAARLPWLAGGDPRDWELYRAAVAHNLDVDTVHPSGRSAGMVGATHGPGATHWSTPAAPGWTYPAAWLDYYYLAGERRGLEALGALVDSLGGRTVADFGRKGRAWTADQAGYLRARLAAHEAFGREHAKAAAAALNFFAGLSARELGGSELWARELAPALIRYHRVFGDAAAARLIGRGTKVYISSRGPAGRGGAVARNCFDACAYAWRLTGDRYFLERGRQLAERSATFAAAAMKMDAGLPLDLATDTRVLSEAGTLPYLEAALRDAAKGK